MAEGSAADAAQCVLSNEEIQHISDAFNFLYHGLREAKSRFKNPVAGDAGRDGAIHALECVLKFFTVLHETGIYPLIVSHGVHAPLVRLFDDLRSLGDGMVSALLAPVKGPGRARASGSYDALKGVVGFTVRRLTASGVSAPEARKKVASELAKQGIRPARKGSKHGSGQFSERTLRKWQEDIGLNKTTTDKLTQLEAAHLQEVLKSFGITTLPTGSTADDLLRQRFGAGDLQRAYLGRLTAYIASTRSQETT
jgi:hypothetical protein